MNLEEKEKKFHDDYFGRITATEEYIKDSKRVALSEGGLSSLAYLPSILERLIGELGELKGKRVLVYGCGSEASPFWFAERGAIVDAFDLSSEAVKIQKLKAEKLGYDIGLAERNAHETGLPSDTYDIVYGEAILHHLDIAVSASEVHRLLKPGGKAVFRDVLVGTLPLRIFRRLTPFWRTSDEHPLTPKDLETITKRFGNISISEHFLSLLPYSFLLRLMNNVVLPRIGIKKFLYPNPFITRLSDKIDSILFQTLPFMKTQAWIVVATVTKKS